MGGDKTKICANCEIVMKGCACQWTASSDGKIVHKSCKEVYEKKLKEKGLQIKCAHCDVEIEGTSYFQAMDGRAVHFHHQRQYEKELNNKNKENHASI
jgi:hypothetical protein